MHVRERSKEDIAAVMEEWRRCDLLTPFEKSIVTGFRDAALESTAKFWEKFEDAYDYLTAPLVSAANKAKARGLGRYPWPSERPA